MLTFAHHPGELPCNVPLSNRCCPRLPIARRARWGWEAVGSWLLVLGTIAGFVQGQFGSAALLRGQGLALLGRCHGLQGVEGFDGCGDDLLQFLESIPQVPAFEDVLKQSMGVGGRGRPSGEVELGSSPGCWRCAWIAASPLLVLVPGQRSPQNFQTPAVRRTKPSSSPAQQGLFLFS